MKFLSALAMDLTKDVLGATELDFSQKQSLTREVNIVTLIIQEDFQAIMLKPIFQMIPEVKNSL